MNMMNSNEKEEGERLNINLERECTSSSQLYLGEIKRFISYYFTCLYVRLNKPHFYDVNLVPKDND